MTDTKRAWAMRTSRNSEEHRKYIVSELEQGRLRQGWGYDPSQDLRIVEQRLVTSGYASLSDEQKSAWGHAKFLGEASTSLKESIRKGDLVLVPNMPTETFFTVCEVTGDYDFQTDEIGDFGHVRKVKILTRGGVANSYGESGLARSLRCRSRLWSLDQYLESLSALIAKVHRDGPDSVRLGQDHLTRVQRSIAPTIEKALHGLADEIEPLLRSNLQSAEWEPILQAALTPLTKDVKVYRTGGPNEKGADLEIHIPNPFMPNRPWVVVVQVKDYDGTIHVQVADQLEEAIKNGEERFGQLIAIVLASTRATPSDDLNSKMAELSKRYGISISCVHGKDLMRTIAQGLSMRPERQHS